MSEITREKRERMRSRTSTVPPMVTVTKVVNGWIVEFSPRGGVRSWWVFEDDGDDPDKISSKTWERASNLAKYFMDGGPVEEGSWKR